MSDELQRAPEAPSGGSQGQTETTPEAQAQPPATVQVNLDDLPEFREWKSKMDKKLAEAEKTTREALLQAEMKSKQAESVIKVIQEADPKAAASLQDHLVVEGIKAERDMYKKQAEWAAWFDQTTEWCGEQGLDVNSPEIRAAIRAGDADTLNALAHKRAVRVEAEAIAKEIVKQMGGTPTTPVSTPAANPTPNQPRPAGGVLPPSGGSRPANSAQEALQQECGQKLETFRKQGRMDLVRSTLQDYRQKAREQGIDLGW